MSGARGRAVPVLVFDNARGLRMVEYRLGSPLDGSPWGGRADCDTVTVIRQDAAAVSVWGEGMDAGERFGPLVLMRPGLGELPTDDEALDRIGYTVDADAPLTVGYVTDSTEPAPVDTEGSGRGGVSAATLAEAERLILGRTAPDAARRLAEAGMLRNPEGGGDV